MTPEQGAELRSQIAELLHAGGDVVVVDFDGYRYLSSMFINQAFGRLAVDENLDQAEFFRRLELLNLSDDDLDKVKLSLVNAMNRRRLMQRGDASDGFDNWQHSY